MTSLALCTELPKRFNLYTSLKPTSEPGERAQDAHLLRLAVGGLLCYQLHEPADLNVLRLEDPLAFVALGLSHAGDVAGVDDHLVDE